MNPQTKSLLQVAAIIVLTICAIVFAVSRGAALRQTSEQNAKVWFYDQSEKQLYPAPINTLPPHKGIGGKKGDGVRAMVIAFGSESTKSSERRIAYLETYSPELKDHLDRVQAARTAGKPFAGTPPARDSDFFQTNTLVKRVEDADWHSLNSSTGVTITSEWRSWRGTHGELPRICVP